MFREANQLSRYRTCPAWQQRVYPLTRVFLVVQWLGGLAAIVVAQNVIEIESGTATFNSTTNMPGIEIKGKSNALVGRVEISQQGESLVLQRVEASVPVKSLATGMKVRDEHMREYIFRTSDGKEPDLQFRVDTATCPKLGADHRFVCQLAGNLTILGVARPLNITLHVKEQSASAFRVDADGIVKLSDYGIVAPSQFGVTPQNEVKLHIEFTGKQQPSMKAAAEGKP